MPLNNFIFAAVSLLIPALVQIHVQKCNYCDPIQMARTDFHFYLCYLHHLLTDDKGGTLVVCPASLLNQWEGEVNKRVKRGVIDVEVYHGTSRESRPRR
jgi:hypothetical protein